MRWAAQVMRSVIVDFARRRLAGRRGGGAARVTLDVELRRLDVAGEEEILGVHQALDRIAAIDPRLTQVVEMRYFGGMTEPEIAQALGVTERDGPPRLAEGAPAAARGAGVSRRWPGSTRTARDGPR